jgi:hypothetical protein
MKESSRRVVLEVRQNTFKRLFDLLLLLSRGLRGTENFRYSPAIASFGQLQLITQKINSSTKSFSSRWIENVSSMVRLFMTVILFAFLH